MRHLLPIVATPRYSVPFHIYEIHRNPMNLESIESKIRYCWAQDAAIDSYGYPRVNYMSIQYVSQALSLETARGNALL